ncbi:MAG: 4a-hydroxytetrahydrobiopterin dehydratase [Planctomycetota bacterium]
MEVVSACELTAKKCKPCEGGVEPCTLEFSKNQMASIPEWTLSDDGKMISRKWVLKNFVEAMSLANKAGEIAEEDQHHPDLHLTGYRNLRIDLTTHAIGGLSENDFILAAKLDAAASAMSS